MIPTPDPTRERPVRFTPACVAAILAGEKRQARRAVADPSLACPFGAPGDRLWLQEPWRSEGGLLRYLSPAPEAGDWQSAASLPREAARVVLEILSTRLERLQQISAADLVAEGDVGRRWPTSAPAPLSAREAFARWWDSVHRRPGTFWADDPWVWVVEFRCV